MTTPTPETPACRWSSARSRWETVIRPGVSAEACGHNHAPETPAGCDCETCMAGDDRWCCRRCHDLARRVPETPAGGLTTALNTPPESGERWHLRVLWADHRGHDGRTHETIMSGCRFGSRLRDDVCLPTPAQPGGLAEVAEALDWLFRVHDAESSTKRLRIVRDYLAAVAQASAEAEAEIKHWKDHAEEAGQGFAQVCRDSARHAARAHELSRALEVSEQARAETLREVDDGEWFTEADVRAIRTRIEAVREGPRHCGCAWCCASVRPEYRGEAHQRTCHPLTATEDGDH